MHVCKRWVWENAYSNLKSMERPINLFFIQFNVPFSSYGTGQSVGGAKTGELREKPPGTSASRTWLVSHVVGAGLEPTPDTAVKMIE